MNVKMNLAFVITLSILPDIDLLIPMLEHGGPTHSIILLSAIALPAFLVRKKQTIPYLLALVSHPLLGDYPTRPSRAPGVQLLFPLTSSWFSAGSEAAQLIYVYIELILFAAFLTLTLTTKDKAILTRHHTSSLLLAIPILTALLPVFIQFPMPVPPVLIIPHLILLILLTLPILIDIEHIIHRHSHF